MGKLIRQNTVPVGLTRKRALHSEFVAMKYSSLAWYKFAETNRYFLPDSIVNDFSNRVKAEEEPVSIILSGQKGSGKSELDAAALLMLKGNAVICNQPCPPFNRTIKDHSNVALQLHHKGIEINQFKAHIN